MNTTTINITWDNPVELIQAMERVSKLTKLNVYADENMTMHTRFGNVSVKQRKEFTRAALAIVLDHFNVRQHERSSLNPTLRRLIWYYVITNFPKTSYREIGSVSNHDHSTVVYGFKKCNEELHTKRKTREKKYKDEVFIKCDEVFKGKVIQYT